jgi:hypothetical protein
MPILKVFILALRKKSLINGIKMYILGCRWRIVGSGENAFQWPHGINIKPALLSLELGWSSEIDHFPTMCEVLGSISNTKYTQKCTAHYCPV